MLLLDEADTLEVARAWGSRILDVYAHSFRLKCIHNRLLPVVEVVVSSLDGS